MGFTTNLHINLLPASIEEYSVNLFAQLGYKTAGYWQGEVLSAAFLWRVGLSYKLKPIEAKSKIIKIKKKEHQIYVSPKPH